jgi:hypothetical protein
VRRLERDSLGGNALESSATLLSSRETFIMKVLLPILWIGGFAAATVSLFLFPDAWHGADGGAPDPGMKWTFLAITSVGALFIWWTSIRLKRVRMDDHALYISNYAKEIVVPLANVVEVTENRWINIHPVTVVFHAETEFGSRIVFMPKVRWFAFWSSHPVVDDIRRAVARATGRGPGDVAS